MEAARVPTKDGRSVSSSHAWGRAGGVVETPAGAVCFPSTLQKRFCAISLRPQASRFYPAPLGTPLSILALDELRVDVIERLDLKRIGELTRLFGKLFYLPCQLVACILNLWWNWDQGYLLIDPTIARWKAFFNRAFCLLVGFLLRFSKYQDRVGLGFYSVIPHAQTKQGRHK
jgi:hypothetical protein